MTRLKLPPWLVLLLPAILILAAVVLIPLVLSLWSSFTPFKLTKPDTLYKWIGLFNYEKAVALNSDMDEAYYNLAVCLFLQGYFNECKLNVQRALRANPKVAEYTELLKEVSAKSQI